MASGSHTYCFSRALFQRGLALVYFIAFAAVVRQFVPLLGERGLLPVPQFIKQVSFWNSPSIFFLFASDRAFMFFGWAGIFVSLFALSGVSEKSGNAVSVLTWFFLWLLYLSYVNVGQIFYSFGWETMLVEAGFYAMFLGAEKSKPSFLTNLMLRWMLFRVMFGAGLIKIRGDSCWRDLTCLQYHYETQPIPNPLSWYFHFLPAALQKFSVLVNHFIELVLPFFYFAPQPFASVAGALTIFFHGWLAASGNFAFLGFLTMVLAIPTLSDKYLCRLLRKNFPETSPMPSMMRVSIYVLSIIVLLLSYFPVVNLISPRQAMNASFNPIHLVGTYGAFGSITRPRYEVIIEGTSDEKIGALTQWKEYEFIAKPGDVKRRPRQIAPYHLRLDWLMWFQPFRAAVTERGVAVYGYDPWFLHFIAKLLRNDRAVLSLMAKNPFEDSPPKFIRALFYEYHFTTPQERRQSGAWWKRELKGEYLPPLSLTTPKFREFLEAYGWMDN